MASMSRPWIDNATDSAKPVTAAASPVARPQPTRTLSLQTAPAATPITRPSPNPTQPAAEPVSARAFGKPSLNSGFGAAGEPIYDNASVARMGARAGAMTQNFGARPQAGDQVQKPATPAVQPGAAQAPAAATGGGYGASTGYGTSITRPTPAASDSGQLAITNIQRPALAPALTAQRDLTRTARADAADVLNPMSADAELMRRLEMSQNSYFNKGSPSARRAIADAYLGQMGARTKASLQGQEAGNTAINRDLQEQAETQRVGLEQAGQDHRTVFTLDANTATADADRAHARDIAGMQDSTRRAEIAASTTPRSEYRMLHDGTLLTVTGGKATRVVGEDGQPIRLATQDPNALTGKDVAKAYTDKRSAILGLADQLSPEELGAHFDALDASPLGRRYAETLNGNSQGGGGGSQNRAKPSFEVFRARAAAQGSRMSPEELRVAYDEMEAQ